MPEAYKNLLRWLPLCLLAVFGSTGCSAGYEWERDQRVRSWEIHENNGFNLAQQEHFDEAQRELAVAAKEAASSALGPEYEAFSLVGLADVCQSMKQYDAAQSLYEKAAQIYQMLALRDATSGWARQLEAARAWSRMANCLQEQEKNDDADKLYQKSISLAAATVSDSPVRTKLVEADLNAAYSAFLAKTGRAGKTEDRAKQESAEGKSSSSSSADGNALLSGVHSDFRRKIDMSRAAFSENRVDQARSLLAAAIKDAETRGSGDPEIAAHLLPLGEVCTEQREFAHAEKFLRQFLSLREGEVGKDGVDLIPALNALGSLYDVEHKGAETVRTFQRVRTLQVKKGDETGWIANSDWRISEGYTALGDFKQAYEYLKRAISEMNEVQAAGDVATNMLYEMAGICAILDRDKEAEDAIARALKIIESKQGKDSAEAAKVLQWIALDCQKNNKLAFAEKQSLRSLDTYRRRVTLKDEAALTAWRNLLGVGNAYVKKGDLEQAIRVYKSAIEICEKDLGPGAPAETSALNLLGKTYAKQGKLPESIAVLKQALQVGEKNLGNSDVKLATTCAALGQSLMRSGKTEEALPLFERTLALFSAFNGKVVPWMIGDCESSALALKKADAPLSEKLSSMAMELQRRRGVR